MLSKSDLAAKPGHKGEIISAITSIQPRWLLTIVEGGPLPRLGILCSLVYEPLLLPLIGLNCMLSDASVEF